MTARFSIAVDSDNGHHVRFRLFAAPEGQHPGLCGQLVMRANEFVAFRELIGTALTDGPALDELDFRSTGDPHADYLDEVEL